MDARELKYPAFHAPASPKVLITNKNMVDAIAKGDILLHHPYQSFTPVMDFLYRAATDPRCPGDQADPSTGPVPTPPAVDSLVQAAKAGKVRVQRSDAVAVFEHDGITVTVTGAQRPDPAISRGPDRRTGRRSVIHPPVCADRVEYGVAAAQVKGRADTREVDGRASECLPDATAFGCVVVRSAALAGVQGPPCSSCRD